MYCVAQDGNLRQCAVYGLGVAAQHQRAAFAQVAQPAVAALMAVIRKPGAREEDNAMATENAIGALGKVRSIASKPSTVDVRVCASNVLAVSRVSFVPVSLAAGQIRNTINLSRASYFCS